MKSIKRLLLVISSIVIINVIIAKIVIELAYLERGYNAAGGEWIVIAFLAFISLYIIVSIVKRFYHCKKYRESIKM